MKTLTLILLFVSAPSYASYKMNPYTNQRDYYETAVEQNYNAVSGTVTLQGNTFNGNSQLVKTNTLGLAPVSVTGSAALNVLKTGDTMTGFLNVTTYLNVTGTATANGNFVANSSSTFNGSIFANGIIANTVQATLSGPGAGITGIPQLSGLNLWTGTNQYRNGATFDAKIFATEIQLSSAIPSIVSYDGVGYHNLLVFPGLEVNTSAGYAYNWITASTDSLNAKYYTAPDDTGSWLKFDKYGLVISSGIRAGASRVDGSGGVNIIDSNGKIPALTSTYLASLDGSALTGVLDNTKVLKAGDAMSGPLTVYSSITISSDLLDYNLILTGGTKRSVKLDDRNASASTHNLAEIDFMQIGTIKHQISAYGDTNATYPQELQLGSPSGTNSKVRITGNSSLNPDIFVSSFTSVGINTASPNLNYKLDVNGAIRADGGMGLYSRTMAQLLGVAPDAVGIQYFCNNCIPPKTVVSTGTSAGNFASAVGGTFE